MIKVPIHFVFSVLFIFIHYNIKLLYILEVQYFKLQESVLSLHQSAL